MSLWCRSSEEFLNPFTAYHSEGEGKGQCRQSVVVGRNVA